MQNCNEPAFPCENQWNDNPPLFDGLTKREYFAAMAMHAYVKTESTEFNYTRSAIDAVRFADALIKELAKEQQCALV